MEPRATRPHPPRTIRHPPRLLPLHPYLHPPPFHLSRRRVRRAIAAVNIDECGEGVVSDYALFEGEGDRADVVFAGTFVYLRWNVIVEGGGELGIGVGC